MQQRWAAPSLLPKSVLDARSQPGVIGVSGGGEGKREELSALLRSRGQGAGSSIPGLSFQGGAPGCLWHSRAGGAFQEKRRPQLGSGELQASVKDSPP